MTLQAVVFDAYGTLLDVHGAMQRHAEKLPPDWERISAEWRQKQLEYTWVETLGAGPHRDFWQLTRAALDFVATRHRITDPAVLDTLMDAYRTLPAFKDSKPVLAALRERGVRTAILSNGEPAMLRAGAEAAGLAPLLDAVVSIEEAGLYKPHPDVYGLVVKALGLDFAEMGFVSSNAWDAQAAARAGFRVFWCNRSGQPEEYGLHGVATALTGLSDLPTLLS